MKKGDLEELMDSVTINSRWVSDNMSGLVRTLVKIATDPTVPNNPYGAQRWARNALDDAQIMIAYPDETI